jgi:hypothetical protein
MQVMVNSLNQMPLSTNKLNGSKGIGVLLSNSMMFQRFPTHAGYDDPQLSNFYGMAIPLLKRGVPVETVHIENLANKNTLKDIKVLIMSYANMKPLAASFHEELAKWVKNGGVLLYYGKDTDPFQNVKEWWNTNGNTFKAPSAHLFQLLGLKESEGKQEYSIGKGKVYLVRKDPKELIMQANGDADFLAYVKSAYENDANAGKLIFKNNFVLQRGPFTIAAVLNETEQTEPLILSGLFIDLFNPELPIVKQKTVNIGAQAYLFDVSKITTKNTPQVLAAAGRLEDQATTITKNSYSFLIKSPANTINAMRILLPKKPKAISANVNGKELSLLKNEWDENSKTLLLGIDNYSEGVKVKIAW